MTSRSQYRKYLFCFVFIFIMVINSYAYKEKEAANELELRAFKNEALYISQMNVPLAEVMQKLANQTQWQQFILTHHEASIYIDPRSGRPSSIVAAIPFLPGTGTGNQITMTNIAARLGYPVKELEAKDVRELIKIFIAETAPLLNIDANQIGEIRIEHTLDYLWSIHITRQVQGIPVRDASISFAVNHGNIVLWGTDKWGDIATQMTVPAISGSAALDKGFAYIGGRSAMDQIIDKLHLEFIPLSAGNWNGTPGQGYEYRLAWVFKFKRAGLPNTWEMIADARSGEIIAFQDLNRYDYKKIIGAVYPLSNDGCGATGQADEVGMLYADTGLPSSDVYNDLYTNMNGLFNYSSGSSVTALNGRYSSITDGCGTLSETGDSMQNIDLAGDDGDNDCDYPFQHSYGDTMASRTAFYEVGYTHAQASGWVGYSWMNSPVYTYVNQPYYNCNAYYDASENSLNFYKSGKGCSNMAEITGIIDHEWGHGLDYHDNVSGFSSPAEATPDLVASFRTHQSCPGRGFWQTLNWGCGSVACSSTDKTIGYNCDGYGDCCTNCTGARDIDYANHTSGTAHTASNFVCTKCGKGSSQGPCNKNDHCESALATEAAWDLATRDFTGSPCSYDSNTAFELATRLFYVSARNVTSWYSCNCSSNSSNGCGSTSGYMQYLATDDDDGNIYNGTPHMTAIYNAFDRHGIACSSPSPVRAGCSSGPTAAPTLAMNTPGTLTWNSVSGASEYYVYKTIGSLGCDQGKIKFGATVSTTYQVQGLPCVENNYAVQAVANNQACLGAMSNCVSVVDTAPAPTNVTATGTNQNRINVTWTGSPGAEYYKVYRAYYRCNVWTQALIADNVTETHYSDENASNGITYYYSVAAVYTCTSAQSGWATAVAEGTCMEPPCFDGIVSVRNNSHNPCSLSILWQNAISSCSTFPDVSYTIYKSTSPIFVPNPSIQLATCIHATGYTDTDVAYGIKFYYLVRSEDSRNGGGGGACNGGNFDKNRVIEGAIPTGAKTTLLSDDFESGLSNWTTTGNWNWNSVYANSGTYSAHSGNANGQACDTMTLTNYLSIPAQSTDTLRFYSVYDIQDIADAGIIQGSSNGTTWTKLFPSIDIPYPGIAGALAPACLGSNPQPAFNDVDLYWKEYGVDVSSFAGGNFKVRFNYASNSSTPSEGWWIDDVSVESEAYCINGSSTCTTPPSFDGLQGALNLNSSPCFIHLQWQPAYSTCLSGPGITYHIYRSTTPGFSPSSANRIAACFTGTTFDDYNVSFGNAYYYIVRAEDSTSNGTGPCNSGNIDLNVTTKKISPTGPWITAFIDDFESGMNNWTISSHWHISSAEHHSGLYSANSSDTINQCDTLMQTNAITLPSMTMPRLVFWSKHFTQHGFDGGIVEASVNGTSWTILSPNPPPPSSTDPYATSCIGPNQPCFTGLSSAWTQYTADLSSFESKPTKIRFLYGTDSSVSLDGWDIDDVAIQWGSICTSLNAPGTVPDHNAYPGIPLTITKLGTNLLLAWSAPPAPCQTQDYSIYRGLLPWQGYNHTTLLCTTGGATSISVPSGSYSYYYLVTAQNVGKEGSYGVDSSGAERPASGTPCLPLEIGNCN